MKKLLLILFLVPFFTSAEAQQKKTTKPARAITQKVFNSANKSVTVYTTADKTDLRISETEKLQFSPFKQPMETEVFVLVDPSKTFQSFLGIGGALTDASAETFAKLSPAKQKEFMTAYYDVNKGIGYTLARTNIASCDFSSGSYADTLIHIVVCGHKFFLPCRR